MEIHKNTLYVQTPRALLRRDHLNIVVEADKKILGTVPIHMIDSVVVFGGRLVTPGVIELCAQRNVALNFLNDFGRLVARIDAPASSNVLLRREQFRRADSPEHALNLARSFVAGKLHNARNTLLRAAREPALQDERPRLELVARRLAEHIAELPRCTNLDSLRGREGDSARLYFEVFPSLIRPQFRNAFPMNGRSRRPPLDPVNALLSYLYALLTSDCLVALVAAGLDPDVGFLHADRPGRPALALDLLEEFRTLVADRLVLALINRRQVQPDDFKIRDGGAVEIENAARKNIVSAYIARKKETILHPLLDSTIPVGKLPLIQAKILARHIRGDTDLYIPCTPR